MNKKLKKFFYQIIFLSFLLTTSACDTMIYKKNIPLRQPPPPLVNQEPTLAEKNYAALQKALPWYQSAVLQPWPILPEDPVLTPGMKNSNVILLRDRLKATHDINFDEINQNPTYYDKPLLNAVKNFQTRYGLKPDGIVGHDTLSALNVPPEVRLQQIRMNIKRWAALMNKLDSRYILVNIPDYQFYLIENGKTLLRMRVIIGKPDRPTPEIYSTLTRLVLNPYWNVPQSIAQQDIIPKVIANPNYLEETHIKIFDRQEEEPIELTAEEVDWQEAAENGLNYRLRQEPGKSNSLGLVKFEFQNSSSIYMHDTPAKNLFNADKRAFSSGCIRLEKPFALLSYLMQDDPTWDLDRLESIINSGYTRYITVARPIKIIISYLTVWADEKGQLHFRDDLYHLDSETAE